MIKFVVFDLDNTLYDYNISNKYAEEELFKFLGRTFAISQEQSMQLLENAKRNVKNQLGDVASSHNRILYMQNICEQLGVKSGIYAMNLYNTYWDCFLDKMKLYDYVIPVMKYLGTAGIRIGLLTDLTANIQYRKINKLGLEYYFDYIVTSEEVGEEKPSLLMFNKILSKADVYPSETIMIGDDLRKDIKGAQIIGMKTIHYLQNADVLKNIKEIVEREVLEDENDNSSSLLQ